MIDRRAEPLLLALALLTSCAASPGAQPTDGAIEGGGDAVVDALSDEGPVADVDATSDGGAAQVPPTTAAALSAWLSTRAYESWHCEPAPHPARPFGAHGVNRICSNDLLAAHGAGEYPVGAASVKELYSGGVVTAHAVAVHHRAGTTGDAWYWYEGVGPNASYQGVGIGICTGCHSLAGNGRPGHDFIYTQVP
jgi:hypothetical protein